MKKLILSLVGVIALASSSLNCAGWLVELVNNSPEKILIENRNSYETYTVLASSVYSFKIQPPYMPSLLPDENWPLNKPKLTLWIRSSKIDEYSFYYDGQTDSLILRKRVYGPLTIDKKEETSDVIEKFREGGNNIKLIFNRDGQVALKETSPKPGSW